MSMATLATVYTGMQAAQKVAGKFQALNSDSLIDVGKVARVEPVTLVDLPLLNHPVLTDVLQSVNSIFAAYYLQAVSLTVNVGSVNVTRMLDPLNPNRDGIVPGGYEFATLEQFQHALPIPGLKTGLEAYGIEDSASYRESKDITNVANLSVGKLLDVELTGDNNQKIKVPVSIRLIVSGVASDLLVHTLSLKSKDTSVKERYHAWKAGMLSTIKDMVLCQDLIDEHRKALMKDKTGFYRDNIDRNNKNILATLLTNKVSLATASNIVVLSEKTAKQLEVAVNGRLKDTNIRDKVFKDSYIMLMVIVDTEAEMVTIYHRGIDRSTQLSFRDLKGASKDTSVDITKILQSFLSGSAPHL